MTPTQRTDLLALCDVLETFLQKVRQYLATYPDSALPLPTAANISQPPEHILANVWLHMSVEERRRWLTEKWAQHRQEADPYDAEKDGYL